MSSLSPLWQSVIYTMPCSLKCLIRLRSRPMAYPFSIPVIMAFLPLSLILYRSSGVFAIATLPALPRTMVRMLSRISSACLPACALASSVRSPWGRYATIMDASSRPSSIFTTSTRAFSLLWANSFTPTIGVSQWESSVRCFAWNAFAALNSAALSTNQVNSARCFSPSSPDARHSGCHCTPMMLLHSADSTASTTPSLLLATTPFRAFP